jgi:hypothetical protein
MARIDDWAQPYKDRIFEIEKAVDLTELSRNYGLVLSLRRAWCQSRSSFTANIFRLDDNGF